MLYRIIYKAARWTCSNYKRTYGEHHLLPKLLNLNIILIIVETEQQVSASFVLGYIRQFQMIKRNTKFERRVIDLVVNNALVL